MAERRRRRLAAAAAIVVALGAGAASVVFAMRSSSTAQGDEDPGESTVVAAETVAVERRDLVETKEVAGTLGYGAPTTISIPLTASTAGSEAPASDPAAETGTITSLPEPGTVVEHGQSLAEIDGEPSMIVMYSDRPMWRTLSDGVDDGPDVLQLELNLVALGMTTAEELTVDEEFTWETAEAVETLQALLGVEETGEVEPTDVFFVDGPVRVDDQLVTVGAPASGEVLSVTDTTRRVHVDLDVADGGLVETGQNLTVELADGQQVKGEVTALGTIAETPEDPEAAPTVGLDIEISSKVETLDESPVTVHLVSKAAENVLAAPVSSLVALAEGGYAVQVARGSATEMVKVTTGMFADGWVEIAGEIGEGDTVVVA